MRNSPYQKDPATSSNQWAHSQTDDAASPATARSQPSNTHKPSPTPRPLSIPSASTARPWNHPSPQTETAPSFAWPGPSETYPEPAPTGPTPSQEQNSESCPRRYYRPESVPSTLHLPSNQQQRPASAKCSTPRSW